jgi:hypothetical protein
VASINRPSVSFAARPKRGHKLSYGDVELWMGRDDPLLGDLLRDRGATEHGRVIIFDPLR